MPVRRCRCLKCARQGRSGTTSGQGDPQAKWDAGRRQTRCPTWQGPAASSGPDRPPPWFSGQDRIQGIPQSRCRGCRLSMRTVKRNPSLPRAATHPPQQAGPGPKPLGHLQDTRAGSFHFSRRSKCLIKVNHWLRGDATHGWQDFASRGDMRRNTDAGARDRSHIRGAANQQENAHAMPHRRNRPCHL